MPPIDGLDRTPYWTNDSLFDLKERPYHLLVLGGGPIGLEMAAALKLADIRYLQLEAGNLASTISWYAPGTQIFSAPERLAIAGVPFFLNDVALLPNLMQADGIHPNELGQPKLLATVWPVLQPLLRH